MMDEMRTQAERFGAEIVERDATSVDLSCYPFRIEVGGGGGGDGKTVTARALILSTGAQALWLDAEGEEAVRGRGVSTCATCDGAFFKDEDVVVVGGGDAAMEEAVFLTRYARKVTLIHRSETFRASKIEYQVKTSKFVVGWAGGSCPQKSCVADSWEGRTAQHLYY